MNTFAVFDDVMIKLTHTKNRFSFCHGIAYGHRILVQENDYWRVVEINESKVAIEDRDGLVCDCSDADSALEEINKLMR